MRYDYEVFYKKGKENTIAYALSRVQGYELMMIAVSNISSELMAEIQGSWEMDPYLLKLMKPKSPYMWIEGQLTRRGRIVVGQAKDFVFSTNVVGNEPPDGGGGGQTRVSFKEKAMANREALPQRPKVDLSRKNWPK